MFGVPKSEFINCQILHFSELKGTNNVRRLLGFEQRVHKVKFIYVLKFFPERKQSKVA